MLEHQSNNSSINSYETPHSNSNFNDKMPSMPMTPQKNFHLPLPIVGTPNTSALIKSIVQSAKKTELNSSPVRVPFALSPMALKFAETKLNFSPMKAKEPSLVIKEAFLYNENDNEEVISLPFDNKRPHEEQEEQEEKEQKEAHLNKREKLEQDSEANEQENHYHERELEHEHEQVIIDKEMKDDSDHNDENLDKIISEQHVEEVDMNEYINNSYEMESTNFTASATISNSISSLDSLPPLNSSSSSSAAPLISSSSVFPPTNFSTDVLRNLKDPEFTSPELSSAPDCRVSRSEVQDNYRSSGVETVGDKSEGRLSKSSSSGSSTKNHPLLPSGIVKLLEKKRQEKEQQQQSTAYSSSTTSTVKDGKKKFDLKESLKRPLNYKPHIGSIPKKEKD